MTINIRPMLQIDKPVLMKILQNTPEFKSSEVAIAEEVIDDYLYDSNGSGYHVLVAEADKAVVGYICYGPTPLTESTWDIYWIAVAAEKQGRGIGGTLVTRAETIIREARGRLIMIETSSKPEYEKTRHFHLSHGYKLISRISDFYAPGDDKLILQKRLN
jgi:ribosomal protein S18 acetylase RimI-like enzyme